jgi:hypothetical protein
VGKAERFEIKPKKLRQHLGFIQETLQYMTLMRNILRGTLNPDVAASGGIPLNYPVPDGEMGAMKPKYNEPTTTTDSSGESGKAGD